MYSSSPYTSLYFRLTGRVERRPAVSYLPYYTPLKSKP
jgi:hypothetical protein